MDQKYFDSAHRFGRIGAFIGVLFMLGIPTVICAVYGVWPESVGQVLIAGSGLLAVFIPNNISEVLSYSPALGSASYIAFLTGNMLNLKLPCALNAMSQAEVTQGTDEGDIIASIAIGASSVVTMLIIVVGVLLLVPLQPILTSAPVKVATGYMLPALFGGLVVGMLNENCGEYRAKGKLKCIVVPVLLIFAVNAVYPLAGKEGLGMLGAMVATVLSAWVLYRMGQITLIPKNGEKK